MKAKIAGRKPKKLPKRKPENVTSLLDALRKSAGGKEEKSAPKRETAAATTKQKKAS